MITMHTNGHTGPLMTGPPPARNGVVAGIFLVIYVGAFFLYDSSVLGALLVLGTWSPLLGVSCILAIQALVSVSIIVYFARKQDLQGHPANAARATGAEEDKIIGLGLTRFADQAEPVGMHTGETRDQRSLAGARRTTHKVQRYS